MWSSSNASWRDKSHCRRSAGVALECLSSCAWPLPAKLSSAKGSVQVVPDCLQVKMAHEVHKTPSCGQSFTALDVCHLMQVTASCTCLVDSTCLVDNPGNKWVHLAHFPSAAVHASRSGERARESCDLTMQGCRAVQGCRAKLSAQGVRPGRQQAQLGASELRRSLEEMRSAAAAQHPLLEHGGEEADCQRALL